MLVYIYSFFAGYPVLRIHVSICFSARCAVVVVVVVVVSFLRIVEGLLCICFSASGRQTSMSSGTLAGCSFSFLFSRCFGPDHGHGST